MSILDKAKELLHIGEHKEVDSDGEEKPQLIPKEVEAADTGVPVENFQQINVDFWVKKIKADLYKAGISNEVIGKETPKELVPGHPVDPMFILISVPKKNL